MEQAAKPATRAGFLFLITYSPFDRKEMTMKHITRLLLLLVLVGSALPAYSVLAQAGTTQDQQNCLAIGGTYGGTPDGSVFCLLVPPNWNKDLVIFAHGYVDSTPVNGVARPVTIPFDQLILPDKTTTIPGLITSLGYAFAITSYPVNGLAVTEGVTAVDDLALLAKNTMPGLNKIYLVGASEGGLVTTLAVEQHPEIYSGGVATCGPIGDFGKQINYWGDFRVVFDYFFPGVIPGSPVQIPPALYDAWRGYQSTQVGPFTLDVAVPGPLQLEVGGLVAAAEQSPYNSFQLITVTKAPIDLADPTHSVLTTALGILGYNVLATNNGVDELGGQPYGNIGRLYRGSSNDKALNLGVARIQSANPDLSKYQTSGKLVRPLITLHNTGDPIVPYWHEDLYRAKLGLVSRLMYTGIPVFSYGHCNFTAGEALFAFWLMTFKAGFARLSAQNASVVLPDAAQQTEFMNLAAPYTTNQSFKNFMPFNQK